MTTAEMAVYEPPTSSESTDDTAKLRRIEAWRAEVVEACGVVDRAEEAWDEAKSTASACKAAFDVAVSRMRAIAAEKPGESLFDGVVKVAATGEDAWRDAPIVDLELSASILAKLTEAGLDTVGKLADWTASGKELTDIKGIGAQSSETIADALEKFWARNRGGR